MPEIENPNSRQVGGGHFKSKYQHWDFVEEVGLGYLEAAATKHLCSWRSNAWRNKSGIQDLKKAIHYIEKLFSLYEAGKRVSRGRATAQQLDNFFYHNPLGAFEVAAFTSICVWSCNQNLLDAIGYINQLIETQKKPSRKK